jgi:deoxycytidine triphosphate deaminase
MKWLKRKIAEWAKEGNNIAYDYSRGEKGLVSVSVDNRVDDEPVLNFRIYNAQNGKILEFNKYDRKSDRNDRSIYIVEKDKDVVEYVGKCLSLELLK